MSSESLLYKVPNRKKHSNDNDDHSDSEDGSHPAKSSLLTELRTNLGTAKDNAINKLKGVTNRVSQNRGRMVNIMYKRFPLMKNATLDTSNITPAHKDSLEAYPPLYPQLKKGWESLNTKYIANDLPRLISRITVRTSGISEKGSENLLLSPPDAEQRGSNFGLAKAIIHLIEVLMERLEKVKREDVSTQFEELLESEENNKELDLMTFTQQALDILGNFSPVTRLLKCVHQSMILTPYSILRTVVLKKKLTKDIRGDEGWQIVFTVSKGFVQVKHIRKEQSVDMPTAGQPQKEKNHWEYQWEVSMTFGEGVNEMTSCRLSITDLVLSEGMDKDLAQELTDIMQNGNLIVF